MTMENSPFEDVFPIENGDFPAIVMWSFSRGGGLRIGDEAQRSSDGRPFLRCSFRHLGFATSFAAMALRRDASRLSATEGGRKITVKAICRMEKSPPKKGIVQY